MKVAETIALCRDVLRGSDPMLAKNVVITSGPVFIPFMGKLGVQLYYGGSSSNDDGGGNLFRTFDIGVRIYLLMAVDRPEEGTKASSELMVWCKHVTKKLHMLYSTAVPLAEPIRMISESPTRKHPESERPVFYVDQTYMAVIHSTYDEVKS